MDHFWDLPFVDFAADLIALDVAPFVSNRTMLSEVLTETVRMLAQLGATWFKRVVETISSTAELPELDSGQTHMDQIINHSFHHLVEHGVRS